MLTPDQNLAGATIYTAHDANPTRVVSDDGETVHIVAVRNGEPAGRPTPFRRDWLLKLAQRIDRPEGERTC